MTIDEMNAAIIAMRQTVATQQSIAAQATQLANIGANTLKYHGIDHTASVADNEKAIEAARELV